jgi:formate dehydrogenase major subunit
MVDAIHQGRLKAMYLFGEEMSLVDSNSNYVGDAFAKLEFFVVQDIFFSNTCRYADVVFPGAPSLEKEGTFTSTERRIQRLYRVLEPLEGCRQDWKIVRDIANRLELSASFRGHGRNRFPYTDIRRCRLRPTGGIQVPAMAGRS